MTKVAILGGTGFIGKKISSIFELNNYDIVQFGRSHILDKNQSYCFADLFNSDSLISALNKEKPDVVVSTAWDTEPGKFWSSDLNLKYQNATLDFAEICFRANVSTFIGLGTVSEYGKSPGKCNWSKTSLDATDVYSKSKIETGILLEELGEKYGTNTHWARVFQAFGPNEKLQRYIPSLISSLKNGKKFLVNTPNYILDWIHTEDIASALYFAYTNELSHFLDVGTGIGTSVSEMSMMLCNKFNFDSDLLDFTEAIPGHHKVAVADTSSQLLTSGWAPKLSLSDRIQSLDYD